MIPFLGGLHASAWCASRTASPATSCPGTTRRRCSAAPSRPALAMGNAAVLKPAEDASLSALRFAEIAHRRGPARGRAERRHRPRRGGRRGAGRPSGHRLHLLHRLERGRHAGAAGGGANAGASACSSSAASRRRSSSPTPTSTRALPIIVRAIMQNAGQTCTAGSRAAGGADGLRRWSSARVAEALREAARRHAGDGPRLRPGDEPGAARACRPLPRQLRAAAACRCLPKGRSPTACRRGGYYVRPTLFGAGAAQTTRSPARRCSGRCWRCLAVRGRGRCDRAGQRHRLRAGRRASGRENGGRQQRVAKAVRAGQVFINCYGAGGGVELPFGGTKRSGHGREKGLLALEELSTTKTLGAVPRLSECLHASRFCCVWTPHRALLTSLSWRRLPDGEVEPVQLTKTRRSISSMLLTPVSAMVTSSSLRMISIALATPAWPPAPKP